jgi:carbohydrate phosphorylase
MANPSLAQLVTEAIGDGWIKDLGQLQSLEPLAEDASFRECFLQAKHSAKTSFTTCRARHRAVISRFYTRLLPRSAVAATSTDAYRRDGAARYSRTPSVDSIVQ